MEQKKGSLMRNQEGFTLIEIIAVLVLLGILAAVAVPKYFDFQEDARRSAIESALAAGASQLSMQYARDILDSKVVDGTWTSAAAADVTLGDFKATLTYACGADSSKVVITAGPSWFEGHKLATADFKDTKISVDGDDVTKIFTICP